MKQRIKIYIFFIVFICLMLLVPNKSFSISSSGGYTIESYDINMTVNENNTFDITETISVNFTGSNKHGIFRKIPTKNTVTRLDGTKSVNTAKISNISVSDKYTTSFENGYKVLKIGDKNQTIFGEKTYVIKYNYNIGKDPLKDEDELYYNLIGNEWDTNIKKTTFTINMPKTFDESKLGFSKGYKHSADNSGISYTVTGNTIKGSLETTLLQEQALTVRLSLPEGYFVGASNNYDYWRILRCAICLISVTIAFGFWYRFGRDDKEVETLEFYPPDGLNSAEIGFIYKGHSESKDVVSLLIHLANKGYLKIEEYEENPTGVFKNKSFKITKIKDYDGDNLEEQAFFEGLFRIGMTIEDLEKTGKASENIKNEFDGIEVKEVTRKDLYNKFYKILNSITNYINRQENQEKIFEKESLGKRIIIAIMIMVVFFIMGGLFIFEIGDFRAIALFLGFLITPLTLTYLKPNVGTTIYACLMFVGLGLALMAGKAVNSGEFNGFPITLLIEAIIYSFSEIMLIIFLGIIRKRTEYGVEMLGRIKGFKDFLEAAEKPRLEQLVMEDPEYFYNILPYTYVLGVSNKWMKKFEDISIEEPRWYYGYSTFSTHQFNKFMNSTYSSISTAMTSSPSSSGGTGGGFSGGGSGGGGGGSW